MKLIYFGHLWMTVLFLSPKLSNTSKYNWLKMAGAQGILDIFRENISWNYFNVYLGFRFSRDFLLILKFYDRIRTQPKPVQCFYLRVSDLTVIYHHENCICHIFDAFNLIISLLLHFFIIFIINIRVNVNTNLIKFIIILRFF